MWVTKKLGQVEKIIHSVTGKAHFLAGLIILFLMFLTFTDVLGRYFYKPLKGTFELTELGLATLIFLSLGYTQITKGFVSIGVIVDKWSPKAQNIANLTTSLVSFVFFVLMSWQMVVYAQRLMAGNYVTGVLKIPTYPFVYIAALGSLLFAVNVLLDVLKMGSKAVKKDEC